jgi:hypothetical protein
VSDADSVVGQDLIDTLGHDPARWLDRDLDTPQMVEAEYYENQRGHTNARFVPDTDCDPAARMVRERIEGIRDTVTLRAWRAVERKLGRGPNGGPRERVLEWIESRLDDLDDQPERAREQQYLPVGPLPQTESTVTFVDRDDSRSTYVQAAGSGLEAPDGVDWSVVRERYRALGHGDPVVDDGLGGDGE